MGLTLTGIENWFKLALLACLIAVGCAMRPPRRTLKIFASPDFERLKQLTLEAEQREEAERKYQQMKKEHEALLEKREKERKRDRFFFMGWMFGVVVLFFSVGAGVLLKLTQKKSAPRKQ